MSNSIPNQPNAFNGSNIEISSPYYLGSSDNPSTILVSKLFDGTGFAAWKRSMTLALSAKNKLCFVDGSLNPPEANSDLIHSWNRVSSMVISWILNSLNKEIAESVLFLQTAKEIWSELRERYSQSNGALVYQVQKQLYSINQGSEDFSSYYTKIKKIWDELKMIQEVPACTCESAAALNKFMEEQRLIQLLMGLNDSYKAIRGQILMMNQLPNIATVHSLLIHEERQREISSNPNIVTEAMAMQVNHSSKRNLSCSHYKKTGHVRSTCYMLNGFPADFKFTKSKKVDSMANNVADNSQSISPEKYRQLMQLLNNNNGSTQITSVITDGSMDSAGPFIQG